MRGLKLIGLVAFGATAPAIGESELETFERLAEAAGARMTVLMQPENPPDVSWDAEFRAAAACLLDGMHERMADGSIPAYFDSLTTMAEATRIEDARPPDWTDADIDAFVEIDSECGMSALAEERLESAEP
jgi:hypothetical protein